MGAVEGLVEKNAPRLPSVPPVLGAAVDATVVARTDPIEVGAAVDATVVARTDPVDVGATVDGSSSDAEPYDPDEIPRLLSSPLAP